MLRTKYIRYILMFILLVLIQVVVLNNIAFLGYAIPLVYIYIILKLPINLNQSLIIILGFLLGFIIDIFANTPGINAAATTFIAFLRKPIMSMFLLPEDFTDAEPSMSTIGASSFIKYTILLVFIHEFIIVSIESFSYFNLELIGIRIILSSLLSTVLILGFEGFSTINKEVLWQRKV